MSSPVVVNVIPLPLTDPIAALARPEFAARRQKDPNENRVTQPWVDFFTQQGQVQSLSPTRVGNASATAQAASIGATDISGGNLSAGLYSIAFYVQITRAASTSSSLTVTLDWTNLGQVLTLVSTALIGNTLQTFQSGPTGANGLIRVDGGTPVRYSTTYASVGGTTMTYSIDVVLLAVSA